MKKELKLIIDNNLNIKEFELEFNQTTYDIYFDTFKQDLHVAVLQTINSSGVITRSLSHRIIYAMLKTKNSSIKSFNEFLNGLNDNIGQFLKTGDWGTQISEFILEIFKDLIK